MTRRTGSRPGAVLAVSTVAVGIGSSIGFVIGLLSPLLREDLGISRGRIGLLVGVYFGCTGIGSLRGGRLVDERGPRRTVALDLVIVAVGAVTAALAGTYAVLLVVCVVAGAGYALSAAGTNVAVAAVVADSDRARALSLKTAGVPVQFALGSLVAPPLGDRFGWRPVMAGVGVVALVAAVAAWWALPDRAPRDPRPQPTPVRAPAVLPRRFALFPVACFLLLAGSQPLFSWVVPYLRDEFSVSLAVAGRIAAAGALAGALAMIALGAASDRLGPGRRIPWIVVATAACAAAGALLLLGPSTGLAVGAAGFVVGAAAQLTAIGLMHAAIVDAAPSAVGRASGVTMTGYYLGALVAPFLFGWLADRTDGYVVPWSVSAAFAAASAVAFAACRTIQPVAPPVTSPAVSAV